MTTKAKTILSWLVPAIIGLIIGLIIRQFWFMMVKVWPWQPRQQYVNH